MKKNLFLTFIFCLVGFTAFAQYTNAVVQQLLDKNYINNLNSAIVNKKIKADEIKIIDDVWTKKFTNELLVSILSFDKDCQYDFLNGLIVFESMQMPKFQKAYESALKAANRPLAMEIYSTFHGRPTTAQFKKFLDTPEKTIKYMNQELYYDINMMCSILFDHLFKLKHDQLISNGYPIWKKSVNGKFEYSNGAEALLKFSEELIATFNEPYMFGLNSKLSELGIKEKFNNNKLWSGAIAKDFTHKVLFRDVTPNNKEIWQLRMCLGCNGINELNERLVNGDVQLQKLSGGDPMKVRAR